MSAHEAKFKRANLKDHQIAHLHLVRTRGLEKAVRGLSFGPERLSAMHFQRNKDMDNDAGQFQDSNTADFLKNMEERIEGQGGLKGASQFETVNELTKSFSDLVNSQPFKNDNEFIIPRFLSDLTAEAGHALDWDAMKPGEWQKAENAALEGNDKAANLMFHRMFQERGISVEFGQGMIPTRSMSSANPSKAVERLKEKQDLKKEATGLHP